MKIKNTLRMMLKSILSLQLGEIATDKAVLIWDGDEELVAGMEVFVRDENDEFIPAPDGEYTVEDGKVIKVAEGKVAEIVDPKAEVEEEPVAEIEQEEIVNTDENPAVDPADQTEKDDEEKQEETENEISALKDRIEEMAKGVNELINSMAAYEERIAALEGKLAKVEEPQANPIDQTPEPEAPKSKLSYLRK